METTTPGRNTLNLSQRMRLAELVRADYARERITDHMFAAYAADLLGFPISAGNVEGVRTHLAIPSWESVQAAEKKADREQRDADARAEKARKAMSDEQVREKVHALECEVAYLRGRLEAAGLVPTAGEDRRDPNTKELPLYAAA